MHSKHGNGLVSTLVQFMYIHLFFCIILQYSLLLKSCIFSICRVNMEELSTAASESLISKNGSELFTNSTGATVVTNGTIWNSTDWTSKYLGDDSWDLSRETSIYLYAGLIVICIVLILSKLMLFFGMCIRASINLHDSMFK